MVQRTSLQGLEKKELKAAIKKMFGTDKQFLQTFNPDAQYEAARNDFFCYFGNVPTLAHLNAAYMSNTAQQWLVAQLFDLSEFAGARDKLNESQLRQLAQIIVVQYSYLRVTELMLFFFNFKLGKYAEFYGTVDPLAITKSLRQFMKERNDAIYKYEREIEKQKEAMDRANAITYKEYCKKHGIDPTKRLTQRLLPSPDDGGKEQVQEAFFSAKPKEDDVKAVLKSAHGTVDNIFGLDSDAHGKMVDAFIKRYGMSPQEYIKKHET